MPFSPQTKEMPVPPGLLQLFSGDEEQLYDFLDSLNGDEVRIILENDGDPQAILHIKKTVERDLDNTCKQLCMDD